MVSVWFFAMVSRIRPAVSAITEGGPTEVEGRFFRYDHVPGGWVMFPKPQAEVRSVEVAVGGQYMAFTR